MRDNVLKKNPKSNRAVPYLYYRSEKKHIPPPLYPTPYPPTYPKLLLLKHLGCLFLKRIWLHGYFRVRHYFVRFIFWTQKCNFFVLKNSIYNHFSGRSSFWLYNKSLIFEKIRKMFQKLTKMLYYLSWVVLNGLISFSIFYVVFI